MAIGFSHIPADIRVPLFYAEMDNSAANSAQSTLRRLIVGQVNDNAASAEIGSLVLVSSVAMAKRIGGQGSMLASMYETFRKSDPVGEIWCLPLQNTSGSVAKADLKLTGAATQGGVLSLYVGGVRVQATVVNGATAAVAANALALKVNASADLPVTAAAADGTVTLTAKWTGDSGNDINLQLNRLGQSNGEQTPDGLAATLGKMAGGAGVPDQLAALAALGDEPFEFICLPWADTTSLNAWQGVMDDNSGRWSWAKQLFGHVYTAKRGTVGTLVAAGQARNDQHVTIQAMEPGVPQPFWVQAAALAARTAVFISADASRPTQSGSLPGLDPAAPSERFTLTERQSLLNYGIATAYYEGGYVRIQRAITTYQKNAFGQADNSYLDSETLHQSAFIVRRLQSVITSKYGRHKLASDGTRFGAGQPIVTPSTLRGELIAQYAKLELEGHVENAELFAEHLIVERDSQDPSRINVLFPPDYINGLRVFALLNQFRLQYDAVL
ncbi:phage tail sheath subtilisin-like domain-containing protein [Pseudomonas tolaasii]|uniref:phage tail sheath subtilisin-like domain-containing protein n=1 Tax=Pseudomonas tolaasii TaxID=29442 RepID=UPI0002DB47EC|nr:phage tail sheath subtilisin-like domain-containing protein [Pseudomonas tolaasii]MBW4791020.1 phage tail sheath subtilisin-like domain-containing protein [Pseudomonas tolaasii]NWC26504.1 phage tail sheath subtilisin-like domain-containing protein [Pseudomonas tolaasii]NWC49636.1 phage tail sheath subtilisin-like domain-containing protein [Pseudomonas tolaasii]NWE63568.1 phage tail sheath subtilisin-like domain-containing protein [Pseudomonas tolaasii]QXQ19952.1 phage tail sheath subtilisin